MNLTTFIAELEKLERAATPGPWHVGHINESTDRGDIDCPELGTVCENVGRNNEAFICHSRNALPKLLACVKVLSEAVGFYSVGKLHLDYEKFQTGKGAPNHVVGKFARQALSKCESIIANKGVK